MKPMKVLTNVSAQSTIMYVCCMELDPLNIAPFGQTILNVTADGIPPLGKYWVVGRVGEWMSLTMYTLPNLINCSLIASTTADTHHDVILWVHCFNFNT